MTRRACVAARVCSSSTCSRRARRPRRYAGLRLRCAPPHGASSPQPAHAHSDTAKPGESTPAASETMQPAATIAVEQPLQFVNLSIDGIVYRVPLGSTVSVPVSRKKININVSAAP